MLHLLYHIKFWKILVLDFVLHILMFLESLESHDRPSALFLVTFLYQSYSSQFDDEISILVSKLKKGCHDISASNRVSYMSCLFEIMIFDFDHSNSRGLELFRFLALEFLENYGDAVEQFLLANIQHILSIYAKIPAYTLVDPLLKYMR